MKNGQFCALSKSTIKTIKIIFRKTAMGWWFPNTKIISSNRPNQIDSMEFVSIKILSKYFLSFFSNQGLFPAWKIIQFLSLGFMMSPKLIWRLNWIIIPQNHTSLSTLLYEMPSNLKGKNFVWKIYCYFPQNTMEIICRR